MGLKIDQIIESLGFTYDSKYNNGYPWIVKKENVLSFNVGDNITIIYKIAKYSNANQNSKKEKEKNF